MLHRCWWYSTLVHRHHIACFFFRPALLVALSVLVHVPGGVRVRGGVGVGVRVRILLPVLDLPFPISIYPQNNHLSHPNSPTPSPPTIQNTPRSIIVVHKFEKYGIISTYHIEYHLIPATTTNAMDKT